MITIAIVEDEAVHSDRLQIYLKQFFKNQKESYSVAVYKDGSSFLENHLPIYDLIFMDVEMPQLDGLKTSEILRLIGDESLIIFVTRFIKYALSSYDVKAFDFMVKPIDYDLFAKKVGKAVTEIETKRKKITVKNNDLVRIFSLSELYYVESLDHCVIYHTTKGNITEWIALKEAEKKINSDLFAYVNRSFLVNLSYISEIRGTDALCHDTLISIGVKKRKEFLKKLAFFWGER